MPCNRPVYSMLRYFLFVLVFLPLGESTLHLRTPRTKPRSRRRLIDFRRKNITSTFRPCRNSTEYGGRISNALFDLYFQFSSESIFVEFSYPPDTSNYQWTALSLADNACVTCWKGHHTTMHTSQPITAINDTCEHVCFPNGRRFVANRLNHELNIYDVQDITLLPGLQLPIYKPAINTLSQIYATKSGPIEWRRSNIGNSSYDWNLTYSKQEICFIIFVHPRASSSDKRFSVVCANATQKCWAATATYSPSSPPTSTPTLALPHVSYQLRRQACTGSHVNLVFVLDTTRAGTQAQFERTRSWIGSQILAFQNYTSSLNSDPTIASSPFNFSLRTAMITYGDYVQMEWNLNDTAISESTTAAIARVQTLGHLEDNKVMRQRKSVEAYYLVRSEVLTKTNSSNGEVTVIYLLMEGYNRLLCQLNPLIRTAFTAQGVATLIVALDDRVRVTDHALRCLLPGNGLLNYAIREYVNYTQQNIDLFPYAPPAFLHTRQGAAMCIVPTSAPTVVPSPAPSAFPTAAPLGIPSASPVSSQPTSSPTPLSACNGIAIVMRGSNGRNGVFVWEIRPTRFSPVYQGKNEVGTFCVPYAPFMNESCFELHVNTQLVYEFLVFMSGELHFAWHTGPDVATQREVWDLCTPHPFAVCRGLQLDILPSVTTSAWTNFTWIPTYTLRDLNVTGANKFGRFMGRLCLLDITSSDGPGGELGHCLEWNVTSNNTVGVDYKIDMHFGIDSQNVLQKTVGMIEAVSFTLCLSPCMGVSVTVSAQGDGYSWRLDEINATTGGITGRVNGLLRGSFTRFTAPIQQLCIVDNAFYSLTNPSPALYQPTLRQSCFQFRVSNNASNGQIDYLSMVTVDVEYHLHPIIGWRDPHSAPWAMHQWTFCVSSCPGLELFMWVPETNRLNVSQEVWWIIQDQNHATVSEGVGIARACVLNVQFGGTYTLYLLNTLYRLGNSGDIRVLLTYTDPDPNYTPQSYSVLNWYLPAGSFSTVLPKTFTITRPETRSPTRSPTLSLSPSLTPSKSPSLTPTWGPSRVPATNSPTRNPSQFPSGYPSEKPTSAPSRSPSDSPSTRPSRQPTSVPSGAPTTTSISPTVGPTTGTKQPTPRTVRPSLSPSVSPSARPTTCVNDVNTACEVITPANFARLCHVLMRVCPRQCAPSCLSQTGNPTSVLGISLPPSLPPTTSGKISVAPTSNSSTEPVMLIMIIVLLVVVLLLICYICFRPDGMCGRVCFRSKDLSRRNHSRAQSSSVELGHQFEQHQLTAVGDLDDLEDSEKEELVTNSMSPISPVTGRLESDSVHL